jgi:hypothetical protein
MSERFSHAAYTMKTNFPHAAHASVNERVMTEGGTAGGLAGAPLNCVQWEPNHPLKQWARAGGVSGSELIALE